jgi:hypothetical protein
MANFSKNYFVFHKNFREKMYLFSRKFLQLQCGKTGEIMRLSLKNLAVYARFELLSRKTGKVRSFLNFWTKFPSMKVFPSENEISPKHTKFRETRIFAKTKQAFSFQP